MSADNITGSQRPRVICHMAVSLHGRIVVDRWPESVAAAVRRDEIAMM